MVDFFVVARRAEPSLAFLLLTQDDPDVALREFARVGVSASDYRVRSAEPERIGEYLATARFGLFLYRPGFSDIAVSPTKIGEYLGAGLPVVSVPGVGDTESLLRDEEVGVILHEFSDPEYESQARAIVGLASDPSCRARCETVAAERLSLQDVGIPAYDRVYRQVASRAAPAEVRAR